MSDTEQGNKRKGAEDDTVKKKKSKKDLFKQPTVEELNQLRETENLFHSNLFRLQIEEILNAVRIKDKYKKLFTAWFANFENQISAVDDIEELELNDNSLFESVGIKIPMKDLPNDCPGTLKLIPPSNVYVGGSYSLDTVLNTESSIDIFVEMPKDLFQNTDFRNYRYMRKKAIYLAYIANKINLGVAESKSFAGNSSNPRLKLVPSGNLQKKFVVYVHIVVHESTFQKNKLTAEKNNVRAGWFFNDEEKKMDVNPPTPHYNDIVLHDLTAIFNNSQSLELVKKHPNIRDGIILLKIWLKQRGLNESLDSFNGHVITMFVLYLLHTKKLNTFMSSYQVVRNTWLHLATLNWCRKGISICQEYNQQQIDKYHKHFECVFLDFSGFKNIAASIDRNTFIWVSKQAQMSIDCLNNTRVNSFQIMFMRKVPFYKSFDLIASIYSLKVLENIVDAKSNDKDQLNYGFDKHTRAVQIVSNLLKEGLGNRVSFIYICPSKIKEWALNDNVPDDIERLDIGLIYDVNHCFSIIEKGPSANLPEARIFRNLWGEKSELRRLKDGTICEAVVWGEEGASFAQKRVINKNIIKFLLEQKLKLFENTHFKFFFNHIEHLLKRKMVKVTNFKYGPEEASLQVISTFADLEKELCNLTDMPLSINGIQGSSALFRYTEVFPPVACIRKPDGANVIEGESHLKFADKVEEVPHILQPVEATIQLSTSGKWPDDLQALRMTKAAFNLQIADCMRKQYKAKAYGSFDNISIMKDGFVFRLSISHQKEISLLKKIVEDGVTKYRDNEESQEAEKKLIHLPKITGALYGLYCQQPSFGPACCLAKRWLSAQLIDDSHFPHIAVELLIAAQYMNPEPYLPTHNPQLGFLRFLEYFAQEYWSTDPVIVNFNDEMSRERIIEVENHFGTSREKLPPLFISTSYDQESSMWTRNAPSKMILHRVSALARESAKLIEAQLSQDKKVECTQLFLPPLTEYDCLIYLEPSLNSRRLETTNIGVHVNKLELLPFKEHKLTKVPIAGFDPAALYLQELRNNYSDFALFFHDTYGGNVVGVLFKPSFYEEKDFKVHLTACHKLSNTNRLVSNYDAVIEDFYIIGRGLVKNIDIQSKRLQLAVDNTS